MTLDDTQTVLNRRRLRPGEEPECPGYDWIDGYLLGLDDLADPEPAGITDEVPAEIQMRVAAKLSDLLTASESRGATVYLTCAVGSDEWEFYTIGDCGGDEIRARLDDYDGEDIRIPRGGDHGSSTDV